ncbi:MAG: glucose-6-phosphate isomerase family protein [Candidatus Paceibacterales bacterium]
MEVDLSQLKPDTRNLDQVRKVLFDREFAKTANNIDLYFMYRGVEENNGIRYDITVIPANMLGQEFSKTKGHVHIGKYQEVYTILEGSALYLFQKAKGDIIEDVFVVKAQKGDVVVIPSDYGHVSINPSPTEELKMANWISSDCKSDYSDFENLQGACYYYISPGTWVKNDHYKNVPPLRFQEPLKEVPKDLDFLKVK